MSTNQQEKSRPNYRHRQDRYNDDKKNKLFRDVLKKVAKQ